MLKIFLVIPAYKPGSGLLDLVHELIRLNTKQQIQGIYVLNDGSGIPYAATFESLSKIPGIKVLAHATNLGKGAALKTLFNTVLVQEDPNAVILTADADGQHSAIDILRLAELAQTDAKQQFLYMGTRTFKKDIPLRSLFGNQMTRGVFWFFSGIKLSDTQSGLRAIPAELARECLKIPMNGYDLELQMLLLVKKLNLSIKELPIETIYIDGNASSHFNPLLDSMRIYFVFIRYCSSSLVTALSDFIVFILLKSFGLPLLTCQFGARIVGGSVAFFFAKNFVFKSKSDSKSVFKFATLVLVSGTLSFALMSLFIQFHFPVVVAKLCAEGTLFVANFAIQREFIFTKKPDDVSENGL